MTMSTLTPAPESYASSQPASSSPHQPSPDRSPNADLGRMQEHVTLLPPERASPSGGVSASLPPDLLEQVRTRISVLALIILIAFSFDPLLYGLVWVLAKLLGYPAQFGNLGFRVVDLCAVAASAALLLAARNRNVPAHR